MKVQANHGKVTQNLHGASRNYRYVWDVSTSPSLIPARPRPHQRRAMWWLSRESFDIWFIPKTLACGILRGQASISLATRIRIGRETRWRGSPLPEDVNSLVG